MKISARRLTPSRVYAALVGSATALQRAQVPRMSPDARNRSAAAPFGQLGTNNYEKVRKSPKSPKLHSLNPKTIKETRKHKARGKRKLREQFQS